MRSKLLKQRNRYKKTSFFVQCTILDIHFGHQLHQFQLGNHYNTLARGMKKYDNCTMSHNSFMFTFVRRVKIYTKR